MSVALRLLKRRAGQYEGKWGWNVIWFGQDIFVSRGKFCIRNLVFFSNTTSRLECVTLRKFAMIVKKKPPIHVCYSWCFACFAFHTIKWTSIVNRNHFGIYFGRPFLWNTSYFTLIFVTVQLGPHEMYHMAVDITCQYLLYTCFSEQLRPFSFANCVDLESNLVGTNPRVWWIHSGLETSTTQFSFPIVLFQKVNIGCCRHAQFIRFCFAQN